MARQAFSAIATAVGDDGGHPLAEEADRGVEDQGVVGVVVPVLVAGGGEEDVGAVAVGEHQVYAVERLGRRGVDRHDPGRARSGLAEHRQMQQPGRGEVHRVLLGARDHPHRRRCADGPAHTPPDFSMFTLAVQGIGDRAISGAAAQVSLQCLRQVGELLLGQRRGRGDHSRGAETALEAARVDEPALHRVQVVGGAQARDGGDVAALGTERGKHAGVHRPRRRPGPSTHRSRPRRSPSSPRNGLARADSVRRHWPGRGSPLRLSAVDPDRHASSRRICSASTRVTARRQSGSPCASSVQACASMRPCAAASSVEVGTAVKRNTKGRTVAAVTDSVKPPPSEAVSRRPMTTTPERPSGDGCQLAERGGGAQCRGRKPHRPQHIAGRQRIRGRPRHELA